MLYYGQTLFSQVYDSFLSKITDDMYLQLTENDTKKLLRELLVSAVPKFEFPRQPLDYDLYDFKAPSAEEDEEEDLQWAFSRILNQEQINILSTYMIVEWLGQQLASVENVRMKYSGADFKFTSQANHMQKLLQMKKDYEREGFHLQRLYKRRVRDTQGVYRSTMNKIMESRDSYIQEVFDENKLFNSKGYLQGKVFQVTDDESPSTDEQGG